MSYKVVRDAQKKVICFGPNDNNYVPTVGPEQTLGIEENAPSFPQQPEYIRQRVAAYPPVQEQLDMIFHEGLDAWKARIAEIKATYPKE